MYWNPVSLSYISGWEWNFTDLHIPVQLQYHCHQIITICCSSELLYALVLNHKLLLERNFKIMCIILLKLHTAICTGFAHLLNSNSCHILKRHVFRKKITSFEVLTMVLSKNKVFWYAMPCQLASSHRYFKGS